MSTNVHLTPELEAFARQCVEEGRYNNVSEVVRSSLRLLQDREQRRKTLDAVLEQAVERAEREGWIPSDETISKMDKVLGLKSGG